MTEALVPKIFKLFTERIGYPSTHSWTKPLWGKGEQFVAFHLRSEDEIGINIVLKVDSSPGHKQGYIHASRIIDEPTVGMLLKEWKTEPESEDALANFLAHLLTSLCAPTVASVEIKDTTLVVPLMMENRSFPLTLTYGSACYQTYDFFKSMARRAGGGGLSSEPPIAATLPIGHGSRFAPLGAQRIEISSSQHSIRPSAGQISGITRIATRPVSKDLIAGHVLPPKRRKV